MLAIDIHELSTLILEAAEKSAPSGGLDPHEALFGPDARLALDSLDALQVSMAIQARYKIRLADSKELRRALSSVAALAQYLAEVR